MTNEEAMRRLAMERDAQMAACLALWISLAAEQYPEELRRAIGKVFSLEAVEKEHQRLRGYLEELQADLVAAAGDHEALHRQLREARIEIDRLKRKRRMQE